MREKLLDAQRDSLGVRRPQDGPVRRVLPPHRRRELGLRDLQVHSAGRLRRDGRLSQQHAGQVHEQRDHPRIRRDRRVHPHGSDRHADDGEHHARH